MVLRVRSVLQERRVRRVNRGWRGWRGPTANRDIRAKRGRPERRERREILGLLEPSATRDLAESKAQTAFADSKAAKARREKMDSLDSKETWV